MAQPCVWAHPLLLFKPCLLPSAGSQQHTFKNMLGKPKLFDEQKDKALSRVECVALFPSPGA